jgi:hypothetical protein
MVYVSVRRSLWIAAIVLAGISSVPGRAGAAGPFEIQGATAVSFLNQQRLANGLPAVSDDQAFATAWCPDEDNGPSGGELGRDLSTVVSGWSATSSPWDSAPLHQQDIYNPSYTQAGDSDAAGEACLGVGAPSPEPATPTFAAFFSDEGPLAVPATEVVEHEGPFAPQELVGVPQGRPTGGQLILYAEGMGPEVHPVSWRLTEANGTAVPHAKLADDAQASAAGYPGYLAGVGVLIPPRLKPKTEYDLDVAWEEPGGPTATQALSFRTGGYPNRLQVYWKGGYLYGESAAPKGTLEAWRGGRTVRATLLTRRRPLGYRGRIALSALAEGRWQVCIDSGGIATAFQAQRSCAILAIGRR